MKTKRLFEGLRYCLILHSAFFILHCHAALPRSWQVNAGKGRVADLEPVFHGEEFELRADFVDPSGQPYALPEGDWKLYFQTNGMDSLYFDPLPATASSNSVSAVFSPTNDPGAAQITGYLSLPGSNYHAAFRLRFLPSPGATPNALPLPTPTLDFAATTILNPPWPAEIADATNALAAATAAHKWPWSSITNAPTTWAWSAISGKPSWIGDTKPSYTPNEIFKDATNWIGVQGNAGRIIKLLAQTVGGVIMGGYQVTGSTLNDNNMTTYAYGGVAVKRDGANQDYLWDTSSAQGIVRRSELTNAEWPWSSITNAPASVASWKRHPLTSRCQLVVATSPYPETIGKVLDYDSSHYDTSAYACAFATGGFMQFYTIALSVDGNASQLVYSTRNGQIIDTFYSGQYRDDDESWPGDGLTYWSGTNTLAQTIELRVTNRVNVVYSDDFADATNSLVAVEMSALRSDLTANTTNAVAAAIEYIESPETVRTNVYTGVSRDTALRDGKLILYHNQTQATGNWTLNLTLADGTTTGPKPVYIWGTIQATTRYGANSVIPLVYRAGAWYVSDYDANSDTYNRHLVAYCKAAAAIPANTVVVGTTNGYVKVSTNVTFDVGMPILYCNGAQTAGKTNGNNWYCTYTGINLANTWAGWAGDAATRGREVYLVGSYDAADNTFTVARDCPFSLEPVRPCIPLGFYNAGANSSFSFLPGPLMRDDLPTFDDMEREITIRLTTTNAYISVSNGVTRIYEVDGATKTLKWEWDMGFAAISNQVNALVAQMLRKIEDTHTWADWGASGFENPFPGAVSLDRGSTYFGSTNVVWTARDGFAVMTAHMPATASGNASQFRIGVDADDWFGMEVTAAYLVDAHCDSFAVSQPNPTRTATITTDYDASYVGAPPLVYFTESLAEPFSRLDTGLTWTHNSSTGVSTVTIQGLTTPAGFFFLKKWEAGGAIMRSTMPILPEGYRVESSGTYIGTVQPDSIITITQGGHTYRLIAEEVQ